MKTGKNWIPLRVVYNLHPSSVNFLENLYSWHAPDCFPRIEKIERLEDGGWGWENSKNEAMHYYMVKIIEEAYLKYINDSVESILLGGGDSGSNK